MGLYLERDDCQKRPFKTAWRTEIFEIIKANSKPMEEPSESAAVERSSSLFYANSPMFHNSIYTCIGLLLFLSACGI
ncbi:unnamed protein product, partial [Porites lobata]